MALAQQRQGIRVGRDGLRAKSDLQRRTAREHFSQMAQQAETGHIGAGMDAAAVWFQLLQKWMLALGHGGEGRVQGLRSAGTSHCCGEQHASAEGSAE